MRARSFVVRDVQLQYAAQSRCTEDDDMVEALPPDRPDEQFGVRVLPRRTWGCEDAVSIADAVFAQAVNA
jgi:hypothetical protein